MVSNKRVLQICHDDKGPFGVIARQYALSFPDCSVHTIFLRGPENATLAESIPGEVTFLQLKKGELRGLKLGVARQLKMILKGQEPSVVIAHRYKPFFIALLLNYSMRFSAVIGVMHEFGFLRRLMRSLFSRFWSDNVFLVGVSEALVKDVLQDNAYLEHRLFTVPHAIEAETLTDPVTARHILGIPLGVYCYGSVGRLVRKKDHQLLLQGFAKLNDDSVLAIVGDGVLRESLSATAAKLGISDRVIFCGSHENARVHYKAFDAFVLSSTHEEAFGIVLLEAMAASVPVVCSDAPGPLSVIGDAALVFKSGDAEDLADQLIKMQSMSAQAMNKLVARGVEQLGAKYSQQAMSEKLRSIAAFDQVLRTKTGLPSDETGNQIREKGNDQ